MGKTLRQAVKEVFAEFKSSLNIGAAIFVLKCLLVVIPFVMTMVIGFELTPIEYFPIVFLSLLFLSLVWVVFWVSVFAKMEETT